MKNFSKLPFIIAIVSLIVSLYLIIQVGKDSPLWIDKVITQLFSGVPESTHPIFIALTELGDKKVIGLLALVTLLWLWIKKKDFAGMAALVFAVALGNEVSKLLKDIIGRPRPEAEHLVDVISLSFPSGHAMVGFIFYSLVAFLLYQNTKTRAGKIFISAIAFLLIFLIGLSRIVLHVHYPSDVIGGYALGYIWVYFWIVLYQNYGNVLNRKK
jgi:membrane-associated phospholipid phosphatase